MGSTPDGNGNGNRDRLRDGGVLRNLFIADGRFTGFQLAGGIRGAGVYRRLMLSHADVGGYAPHLLEPTFGADAIAMQAMARVG